MTSKAKPGIAQQMAHEIKLMFVWQECNQNDDLYITYIELTYQLGFQWWSRSHGLRNKSGKKERGLGSSPIRGGNYKSHGFESQ